MTAPKLTLPKQHQSGLSVDSARSEDGGGMPPESPSAVAKLAPYPSKQLIVLAACRFSEPVAMTSSFPYLFFMIRDFHLTDDEKKIGRYAGLLASSFSFAQFLSGKLVQFGRFTYE